jgi:hypothetical protein
LVPPLKARKRHGRTQHRAPVVLDQHRLAFDHHQELVLAVVPVALARPGAGLERDVADAEIGESGRGREPPVPASGDRLIERRRIAGAVGKLDRAKVDLGHPCFLC